MVSAGSAWSPAVFLMPCGGTEMAGIEFAEAGATQTEPLGRGDGGHLVPTKGAKDFSNQRNTEAAGDLAIMFFTAASIAARNGSDERGRKCPPLLAHPSGSASAVSQKGLEV